MKKDKYKTLCNSILDTHTRIVNKTIIDPTPLLMSKIEDILRKERMEIFDEPFVFNKLKSVINNITPFHGSFHGKRRF
jgi:hypothetical protein